ncbi:hypothetical protein C2G38_2156113 [Gigaspora rosea]|uniref:Uncharacterized protein n=1 Tax=Gigaspora rosea TaxID=44941 RepID=A0A397W9L8_9GLOM|nr:hypothetical protein C2G38_2156113 [Gigaspora rosea]
MKKLKDTEIDNIIRQHFTTPLKLQDNLSHIITPPTVHHVEEIRSNASAQKKLAELKEIAGKNFKELENIYNITTDKQLRKDLLTRISDQNQTNQEEQTVVRYDVPGRLSFLTQNMDLLEYIHELVEYGSADKCRHKEAIKVSVTGDSRDETKDHLDEHYCLASIKGARKFAQAFLDTSIIISQDNKAKIGLGTSPITHAEDISSLVSDNQYSGILKINNNVKPIWISLVDGGPDENPRHFKNIQSYCKLFRKFDLDYLTICMHAPGQSKYNPVERSMFTLSGKLARIILPINHFGNHLDSQGKVIDTELATQNLRYAGTMLCDIWCRDPIFGKRVNATYVDEATDPFINLEFAYEEREKDEIEKRNEKDKGTNTPADISVSWLWIEKHCNIYQYSLDIKRYNNLNLNCCKPAKAQEAMDFLQLFNGFLPPVTKAQDGHYINPFTSFNISINLKFQVTIHLLHPSSRRRPKKNQPRNSESVVEFVLISNSAEIETLVYYLQNRTGETSFLVITSEIVLQF